MKGHNSLLAKGTGNDASEVSPDKTMTNTSRHSAGRLKRRLLGRWLLGLNPVPHG